MTPDEIRATVIDPSMEMRKDILDTENPSEIEQYSPELTGASEISAVQSQTESANSDDGLGIAAAAAVATGAAAATASAVSSGISDDNTTKADARATPIDAEPIVENSEAAPTSANSGMSATEGAVGAAVVGATGLATMAAEPVTSDDTSPEHIAEQVAKISEKTIATTPTELRGVGAAGGRAQARFAARRRQLHYAHSANRALPIVLDPKPETVPRREIVRRALDLESRATLASERARERFGQRQIKIEPFKIEKDLKVFRT